jgi:hypothetical protein
MQALEPKSPQVGTLNGICPYFTMFPLSFPYDVLSEHARPGDWVLDPFCGRGTTNFAGRLLGLPSVGIDSHPLAVSVSQAKLVTTSPARIVAAARHILETVPTAPDLPDSEFWQLAYHPEVLLQLCRLRAGLLHDCRSATRKALRGVILGTLHGPLTKSVPSYFSNQMPRTYAPKPNYSVKYWTARNLSPPKVDILQLIRTRAERYYSHQPASITGRVIQGDSRDPYIFAQLRAPIRWVITSPPYYGMRTYLPDQWLRLWFLGGPTAVDYASRGQLNHSSPTQFASELRQVWQNVRTICAPDARMVIRFGGINDRNADPFEIISNSLSDSGWYVEGVTPAGSASKGRRQAIHFLSSQKKAIEEIDVWAKSAH